MNSACSSMLFMNCAAALRPRWTCILWLTLISGAFSQNRHLGVPPLLQPSEARIQRGVGAHLLPTDLAWIDTSNRAAVRAAYLNFAVTNSVDMGWTGDLSTGNAGSTSAAYMAAALSRINFVRAMSGVPVGIAFDSTFSQKDQQAAMMMSVNHQLSHNPPSSWLYYTAAG